MISNNFAPFIFLATVLLCLGHATAHMAPWHPGMYCINGPTNTVQYNSDNIVHPLYMLKKEDWWMHHVDKCDQYPPADGDVLELPAGGQFTVEIATNRGKTSLSFDGQYASDWPDGAEYPNNYNLSPGCITTPNLHAQNQSMAAGTAFAISYTSDLSKVTPENLAVFTVKYHTPFKRITTYDVPADLPSCPEGGCICAWGWVPNGCGEPNMYMTPYKCKVTGSKSNKVVATAKPPKWCEGDSSACVKGAKQMIFWNQLEGNNIEVDGFDLAGGNKSPAYNSKLGFADGAQNDIFTEPTTGSSGSSSGSSSSGSSSSGGKTTTVSSATPGKPTSSSSGSAGAPGSSSGSSSSGGKPASSSSGSAGAPGSSVSSSGAKTTTVSSATSGKPSSSGSSGAPATQPNSTASTASSSTTTKGDNRKCSASSQRKRSKRSSGSLNVTSKRRHARRWQTGHALKHSL